MKINYWKWAAIGLLTLMIWEHAGHAVAAQYGYPRVTKVSSSDLATGLPITGVSGEIKGFACTSDVSGDIDSGDGRISTDEQCYVLTVR